MTPAAGLAQNEREQVALPAHVLNGVPVPRVKDREVLKRCRRVEDPDNFYPVLVHFECLAERIGLIREEELVSHPVDQDRLRLAEVLIAAQNHFPRRTHKGGVVDAKHHHDAEVAVVGLGPWLALEDRHGPIHALHAAHAVDRVVWKGLHLVEVLGVRVHYPNMGVFHVVDLARRPRHEPGEDAGLLRHQEGGEGHRENQAQILGLVVRQHLQCDEVHIVLIIK